MKSIHHIIVTAIDAGIPENDAEQLATELIGEPEPVSALNKRIETTDAELHRLTSYRNALQTIRDMWAMNGNVKFANVEDRAERLRG